MKNNKFNPSLILVTFIVFALVGFYIWGYSGATNKNNIQAKQAQIGANTKKAKPLFTEEEKEEHRKIREKEKAEIERKYGMGIWEIRTFVDEFRESTGDSYIANKEPITGLFSNSATEKSDLKVSFLISDSSDIAIQLYEYAGTNPVKAYSPLNYTVIIKDKTEKKTTLKAINHADRLSFSKANSKKIHAALVKGGKVQFAIREDNTPTVYSFSIQNADRYDNAHRKLTKEEGKNKPS